MAELERLDEHRARIAACAAEQWRMPCPLPGRLR